MGRSWLMIRKLILSSCPKGSPGYCNRSTRSPGKPYTHLASVYRGASYYRIPAGLASMTYMAGFFSGIGGILWLAIIRGVTGSIDLEQSYEEPETSCNVY